jgi:hypothetical protein
MKVKNISGVPLHFPAAGRDVDAGEVVDVPDDTNLPAEYFEAVKTTKTTETKTTETKSKE